MALLIMLYDGDAERRRTTIDRIRREPLPNASHLLTQEWTSGDWHAISRHAPSTPVASYQSHPSLHVVMGRLLDEKLSPLSPGKTLAQPINGYGVSIQVDAEKNALEAHTDFMGAFPLYYTSGKDWAMVTTAPWMAKCHPDFHPEWDAEGLASVLLTMHIVTGQTVWKRVRRLNAGHKLTWNNQPGFRETCEYRVTAPEPAQRDVTEEIGDRLSAIIRASRDPSAPQAVLLSGGLDSRLLAGYLRQQTDGKITAYTNGFDTDLDVQCARRVAERLQFDHHVWEYEEEEYGEAAKWAARLELASNGMSSIIHYNTIKSITPGSQVINGLSLDCFMQSPHYFRHKISPEPTVDDIIDFYDRWGLPPDLVKRLMPGTDTSMLPDTIREVQRKFFSDHTGSIPQIGLFYESHFRQRHHIAGVAWRLSFGAWPVTPAYDSVLTSLALSVSDDDRLNRKIERDLLCRHFPSLARIPLDGNDASPASLLPSRWWHTLHDRLKGWQPARVPPVTGRQQLRYYRTLDINNPAWRKVREEIEPLRKELHDLFDPGTLAEILPPPSTTIPMQRPIPESASRKTLIGLALIAAEMRK